MDTGFFAAFTALSGGVVDFLVQQSLYAAAVAVVVWTVLAIVKPRHPLLHLALWWFVLARLVLPADFATSWSLRASTEALLSKAVWPLGQPHVNVIGGEGSVPVAATAPPPAEVAALPVDVVTSAAATVSAGDLLPVALLLFWLGGVAAMAILLARSERSARHTITMAEPAEDPLPEQLVAAWARRFGISRPVRVLVTQEATAPFTAGVLRPVIVLPRTLLGGLDAVELSAVIGHEMSHIRSFDAAWRMAERVLLVLFFFHPMVWMAVRRIDTSREAACDISAANSGVVARSAYAKSLLAALKAFRIEPEMAFARTLSIQGGTSDGLKTRLVWLKGETAMSTPAKVLGAVGVVGLGLLVLPMAEARQSMPQIATDTLAAAPSAPSAPSAPAVKAPAAPRAPETPQAALAPVAPPAPSAVKAAKQPDKDFAASLEASIDARIKAEEAAREAELEAAEIQREARLAAADARREASLAAAEARREAEQAAREARLEAQLAAREALDAHRSTMEAHRAADAARRDALLKASEARREAAVEAAAARRKAQDVARTHALSRNGGYASAVAGDRFAVEVKVDAEAIRKQTLAGVASSLRAQAQEMRAHPERFGPQGKKAFIINDRNGIDVRGSGDLKEVAAQLEAEAQRLEREARGQ